MTDRFASEDDRQLLQGREAWSVARYVARERQKRELRQERDVVVLALARDLGERSLAACMGVTHEVIGRVVADADQRHQADSPASQPPMPASRVSFDGGRWADADAHYEALGSGPQITARRGAPPQA